MNRKANHLIFKCKRRFVIKAQYVLIFKKRAECRHFELSSIILQNTIEINEKNCHDTRAICSYQISIQTDAAAW